MEQVLEHVNADFIEFHDLVVAEILPVFASLANTVVLTGDSHRAEEIS